MDPALGALLRRHRALSVAALAVLTLLAWLWLLAGAGMGMDPQASFAPPSVAPHSASHDAASGMARMAPMDSMAPLAPPPLPWSPGRFGLTFAMWWVMMIAMMLPSAAPMILLYARAASHRAGHGDTCGTESSARPATASFLAGYLAVWLAFSLLATGLQLLLERLDLLSQMLMSSRSRWLSSAILVAAGIYQISPLKESCLRRCRNPAQFLSQHYHPGQLGALRMGLLHGAYCVGCCWLLMALLLVGGVMNLAWIALLTLMVAAEKLLPFGRAVALASGVACMAWGAALALG